MFPGREIGKENERINSRSSIEEDEGRGRHRHGTGKGDRFPKKSRSKRSDSWPIGRKHSALVTCGIPESVDIVKNSGGRRGP